VLLPFTPARAGIAEQSVYNTFMRLTGCNTFMPLTGCCSA
jgi:hypothetical protein